MAQSSQLTQKVAQGSQLIRGSPWASQRGALPWSQWDETVAWVGQWLPLPFGLSYLTMRKGTVGEV